MLMKHPRRSRNRPNRPSGLRRVSRCGGGGRRGKAGTTQHLRYATESSFDADALDFEISPGEADIQDDQGEGEWW